MCLIGLFILVSHSIKIALYSCYFHFGFISQLSLSLLLIFSISFSHFKLLLDHMHWIRKPWLLCVGQFIWLMIFHSFLGEGCWSPTPLVLPLSSSILPCFILPKGEYLRFLYCGLYWHHPPFTYICFNFNLSPNLPLQIYLAIGIVVTLCIAVTSMSYIEWCPWKILYLLDCVTSTLSEWSCNDLVLGHCQLKIVPKFVPNPNFLIYKV